MACKKVKINETKLKKISIRKDRKKGNDQKAEYRIKC